MKRRITRVSTISLLLTLLGCGLLGCGPAETPDTSTVADPPKATLSEPDQAIKPDAEPVGAPSDSASQPITTEEALKAAIKEKNPNFNGEVAVATDGQRILAVGINDVAIEDISPLKGMPLLQVDLSMCHVTDISPLRGMKLQLLYLDETGVSDLSPLKGMPLETLYLAETPVEDLGPLAGAVGLQKLNLTGSKVRDLSPLAKTRLHTLWLTRCPVRDISALATVPLVSVTLAETKVSDLSPLKGHPTLQRLHIAGSDVTDLSTLQWLRLTRLVFTPGRITTGIEFARAMPTLQEIDTVFPPAAGARPMSPAQFWPRYDAGEFK